MKSTSSSGPDPKVVMSGALLYNNCQQPLKTPISASGELPKFFTKVSIRASASRRSSLLKLKPMRKGRKNSINSSRATRASDLAGCDDVSFDASVSTSEGSSEVLSSAALDSSTDVESTSTTVSMATAPRDTDLDSLTRGRSPTFSRASFLTFADACAGTAVRAEKANA